MTGSTGTTVREPAAPAGRRAEPVIEASGVTMDFDGVEVLRGIDMTVRRGEIFVIMGPSGCGKTTMLRHLCGLLPPTAGTVLVDGRDVYALAEDELDRLRLRTGLSFQAGALLGSLSVEDNVALPLRENTSLPDAVVRQVARMKLDMVGLLHAAHLLPSSLSGGMRKRAAIARAIAFDPEIVYFDEPSSGLDPITAAEIDNLICKLNAVFGITMVVVTHDLPSAFEIADRVAVFLDGQVAETGAKEDVWHTSNHRIRNFIDRRLGDDGTRASDIAEHLTM